MILEAIKIATNNFETGFHSQTLLGWKQNYDKQGRPLNCDPNFKSGSINIEGKQYWFVRRRYNIRLWDKPADYCTYMADKGDHIEEMDITPDYIKKPKHLHECKVCGERFDTYEDYYVHYNDNHNRE